MCRQASLAVKAAAEVILVGKDLVLQRKERTTGVDEVDHAETVLFGDFLGPNVFLDGNGDEGAALDGRRWR